MLNLSSSASYVFCFCRNESAATPGPSVMLSMWGWHAAEPPTVPQDGAGSEPHAAAEPGPNTNPTPGSEPGRTAKLPDERWPKRVVAACKHFHQQQVAAASPGQRHHSQAVLKLCVTFLCSPQCVPPAVPVSVLDTIQWNVQQQQHEPGSHHGQQQQHEFSGGTDGFHERTGDKITVSHLKSFDISAVCWAWNLSSHENSGDLSLEKCWFLTCVWTLCCFFAYK